MIHKRSEHLTLMYIDYTLVLYVCAMFIVHWDNNYPGNVYYRFHHGKMFTVNVYWAQ